MNGIIKDFTSLKIKKIKESKASEIVNNKNKLVNT